MAEVEIRAIFPPYGRIRAGKRTINSPGIRIISRASRISEAIEKQKKTENFGAVSTVSHGRQVDIAVPLSLCTADLVTYLSSLCDVASLYGFVLLRTSKNNFDAKSGQNKTKFVYEWILPSQKTTLSSLSFTKDDIVELMPQVHSIILTNHLVRVPFVIDISKPFLDRLAHFARQFRVPIEEVTLFVDGRQIDPNRSVVDQGARTYGSSIYIAAGSTVSVHSMSHISKKTGSGMVTTKSDSAAGPTPMFGVPLDVALECEKFSKHVEVVDKDGSVPRVVVDCCGRLYKDGLNVEGIFRVSGSKERINSLRSLYDSGTLGQASDEVRKEANIHNVSGLLTLWIRSLPQPLVIQSFQDDFFGILDHPDPSIKLKAFRNAIGALPKHNQIVLRTLLGLFRSVVDAGSSNKMRIESLAVVVGPSLLGQGFGGDSLLSNGSNSLRLACYLIANSVDLFAISPLYPGAISLHLSGIEGGGVANSRGAGGEGAEGVILAEAILSNIATEEGELSFNAGDKLVVTHRGEDEGYWQGFVFLTADSGSTDELISGANISERAGARNQQRRGGYFRGVMVRIVEDAVARIEKSKIRQSVLPVRQSSRRPADTGISSGNGTSAIIATEKAHLISRVTEQRQLLADLRSARDKLKQEVLFYEKSRKLVSLDYDLLKDKVKVLLEEAKLECHFNVSELYQNIAKVLNGIEQLGESLGDMIKEVAVVQNMMRDGKKIKKQDRERVLKLEADLDLFSAVLLHIESFRNDSIKARERTLHELRELVAIVYPGSGSLEQKQLGRS